MVIRRCSPERPGSAAQSSCRTSLPEPRLTSAPLRTRPVVAAVSPGSVDWRRSASACMTVLLPEEFKPVSRVNPCREISWCRNALKLSREIRSSTDFLLEAAEQSVELGETQPHLGTVSGAHRDSTFESVVLQEFDESKINLFGVLPQDFHLFG